MLPRFHTIERGRKGWCDCGKMIIELAGKSLRMIIKQDQLDLGEGSASFRARHRVDGCAFLHIKLEKWAILEFRRRVLTLFLCCL